MDGLCGLMDIKKQLKQHAGAGAERLGLGDGQNTERLGGAFRIMVFFKSSLENLCRNSETK